jgi:hypothetical protein
MEHLDPDTISAVLNDLDVPESSSPKWQVYKLGLKYRVDLGICGFVRESGEHWDITIDIVDIKTGAYLPNKTVDAYIPKDRVTWPEDMNKLMNGLKELIPRVRGEVTRSVPRLRTIRLDVGEEKGLFVGQKLCVFEREMPQLGDNLCSRRAEGTVGSRRLGRSEAKVAETDQGENPLSGLDDEDLLFVVTK